jgi:DDE family transposase
MIPVKELLDLFPPTLLDRLALAYAVNAPNQFRLTGQTVFLCSLNLLANHPKLTQRLLEETHQQLTGQHADHSSFGKRLAVVKPAYFQAIFRHLARQLKPQMTVGDQRALRLRRVDATLVRLSAQLLDFGLYTGPTGCKRSSTPTRSVKSVFSLDGEEGFPDLLHLCREPSEGNDNPALGDPMIAATQPGDLFLVDAGLTDRDRLLALHQKHGFFVVPQATQKLRVREVLFAAAEATQAPPPPPARPNGQPPPFRLQRVEAAVFENSNDERSPKQQAKWAQMPLLVFHGQRWDQRSQAWKPWVLLTNLPLSPSGEQAGGFTFAEVPELYRRRWEIETFFKFLKQHLSYAHLTSRNENGIRVLIWMALITAVLLFWYKRQTQIDRGWRSVKFWFAEEVRTWTRHLLEQEWATASAWEPG